jgi:hypothetical protein
MVCYSCHVILLLLVLRETCTDVDAIYWIEQLGDERLRVWVPCAFATYILHCTPPRCLRVHVRVYQSQPYHHARPIHVCTMQVRS